MSYAELVDAVDSMSLIEKENFLDLMQKRIMAEKSRVLIEDSLETIMEFEQGEKHTSSIDEIMKDILA